MRLRRLSLLVLAWAAARAGAADASFVRVWPAWYGADEFKRISEYFDGRENTGGRVIRRSHPGIREGYYFVIRVKNPGPALSGTVFRLQVVTPAGPDPRVFTFSADVPAGSQVYDLGLTGADWPSQKIRPVAWKMELVGPDGRVVDARQSFLWAMPEPRS